MAEKCYFVSNVPLIPQDKTMACWYASAQMLVQWRRNLTLTCEQGEPDPSEVPEAVRMYKANNGIEWEKMLEFAQMLGLGALPLQSPSPEGIYSWLFNYGPIWSAGKKISQNGNAYSHVFVIAGISGDRLWIHDPEPVNQGTKIFKPMSWLVDLLSYGAHPIIKVNFLHCPG